MLRIFFSAAILLVSTPLMAQVEVTTSRSDGLESWAKVYEVLSHPRCTNCHVGEDNRPRWSGASYGLEPGKWKYHGMYINGGMDRIGAQNVPCATCHQHDNSDVPHGPPGAEVWLLAPVEMEWFGKSSGYICGQLKDPTRNGERTLEEVAHHIGHDALVLWGWEPGLGREPAPYSAAETAAFVTVWAAAGAPCPGESFPNGELSPSTDTQ